MARFIVAVDVVLQSQVDDMPERVMPWSDAVRGLFADSRMTQALDVFSLIDVRRKLMALKAGEVAELRDDEWAAILPVLRRPAMHPQFVYSGEAFFRAFIDAPAAPPKTPA